MLNLANKRIAVTGGDGFLGGYVVDEIRKRGVEPFVVSHSEYDLRNQLDVTRMFSTVGPDVVIHCAARVGGIGANMKFPGAFFYDNAVMGIELMDQARKFGVEKYVQIGTTCSYPKLAPSPFKESDLWAGYPEETNAGYGIAKRTLLAQATMYRKQYGLNVISLIPTNLYGPHDDFHPEHSHIIPAVIRKMVENPNSTIDVWGTGSATRDFLYAADAAEGIVLATEHYDSDGPVNLGTAEELRIRDIVELIAVLTDFKGGLAWDKTKPDGQPYRCLDISVAGTFGWKPRTSLMDGLVETIKWFRENRERLK